MTLPGAPDNSSQPERQTAEEIVDGLFRSFFYGTMHVADFEAGMRSALSDAVAKARADALEEAIRAAVQVGNFGDCKREELTSDYGQPRFDMMHNIIAAIRSLPAKEAGNK